MNHSPSNVMANSKAEILVASGGKGGISHGGT